METMILTHKWQEQGLGTAPFSLAAIISVPGSGLQEANPSAFQAAMHEAHQQAAAFGVGLCTCEVCGTGLVHNFIIRDAKGKFFVVGSDCVAKTGDSKLITATEAAQKAKAKTDKAARDRKIREERTARWEAEAQAQRVKNGGLTDAEIAFRQQEKEQCAAQAARQQKIASGNQWLIEVLEQELQRKPSDFLQSVTNALKSGEKDCAQLGPKLHGILADIYARVRGPQLKAAGWTKPEYYPGIQTPKDAAYVEFGDYVHAARRGQ